MKLKGKDILDYCREHNCPISEFMLNREAGNENIAPGLVKEKLLTQLDIMRQSINRERKVKGGGFLIGGEAQKVWEYMETAEPLSGRQMTKACVYALQASETNAAMGKIVAAPTAGACGILPAVLFTVRENGGLDDDDLIKGLLTAGAVGVVIAENAFISGAMGGCQSESGTAAAMAAAAAVEMCHGSPEMALDAAAIALSNVLGLICDPVCGLVEYPCNMRNVLGTANALLAADIVLSGVRAVIPFDETVGAMYEVGLNMAPAYKEAAQGGLAKSDTAVRLAGEIIG